MSGKLGVAEHVVAVVPQITFPWFIFFYVLYVESCHLQSWQVLSLLFHAFWHWNGWIIVDFFLTKFLFCWFQSLIDPFFTSFFPLSLCASLDMAHRGVLRCVSSLLSFLSCFFLPCWGRMMWYTRVILPCSCPNTTGFADFSHLHLAWLPCTGGSLGNRMSPLYAHTYCLSISFSCVALCRFAPLCYTGLSLKFLGLKLVFFPCQDGCYSWSRAWVGTELSEVPTVLSVNHAVRNPSVSMVVTMG